MAIVARQALVIITLRFAKRPSMTVTGIDRVMGQTTYRGNGEHRGIEERHRKRLHSSPHPEALRGEALESEVGRNQSKIKEHVRGERRERDYRDGASNQTIENHTSMFRGFSWFSVVA